MVLSWRLEVISSTGSDQTEACEGTLSRSDVTPTVSSVGKSVSSAPGRLLCIYGEKYFFNFFFRAIIFDNGPLMGMLVEFATCFDYGVCVRLCGCRPRVVMDR